MTYDDFQVSIMQNMDPAMQLSMQKWYPVLEPCNYADDTTIYVYGPNVENVVAKLENDALAISEWFPHNRIELSGEKYHLMIFGGMSNEVSVKIEEASLKESRWEASMDNFWSIIKLQTACQNSLQKGQPKTSCPCENILLHGHGKVETGNAGIHYVPF